MPTVPPYLVQADCSGTSYTQHGRTPVHTNHRLSEGGHVLSFFPSSHFLTLILAKESEFVKKKILRLPEERMHRVGAGGGRMGLGELWPLEGGGTLRVREEEPWVYLEAVRPEDGRGLYKVWCLGAEGEFLLGTLVPRENRLHLERRVAKRTLQEAGAWPLTGGKAVMVYPFTDKGDSPEVWHSEAHPEKFCADPVVRACLQGAEGLLSREKNGVRQLAAPFLLCKPILLNTLFCLAQVRSWQGRRYLVWSFDRQGRPILPTF